MRWVDESHNAVDKAFLDVKLAHFDFIKKQEAGTILFANPFEKRKTYPVIRSLTYLLDLKQLP